MSASGPGVLYLLPTGLGCTTPGLLLPAEWHEVVRGLDHFIAENPRTARAFLKQIDYPRPLNATMISRLDKNTAPADIPALLAPLHRHINVGLLSEAGCPAVADPGALLVRMAHQQGMLVKPLVGPSAILLALMASGLNGQRFTFHGYLPIEQATRARRIRELEQQSIRDDATQIFIETPYRSDALLRALTGHCTPQTLLCVAVDLTQTTEEIITRPIAEWRGQLPTLGKRPAVFLIYGMHPARRIT